MFDEFWNFGDESVCNFLKIDATGVGLYILVGGIRLIASRKFQPFWAFFFDRLDFGFLLNVVRLSIPLKRCATRGSLIFGLKLIGFGCRMPLGG